MSSPEGPQRKLQVPVIEGQEILVREKKCISHSQEPQGFRIGAVPAQAAPLAEYSEGSFHCLVLTGTSQVHASPHWRAGTSDSGVGMVQRKAATSNPTQGHLTSLLSTPTPLDVVRTIAPRPHTRTSPYAAISVGLATHAVSSMYYLFFLTWAIPLSGWAQCWPVLI